MTLHTGSATELHGAAGRPAREERRRRYCRIRHSVRRGTHARHEHRAGHLPRVGAESLRHACGEFLFKTRAILRASIHTESIINKTLSRTPPGVEPRSSWVAFKKAAARPATQRVNSTRSLHVL